MKGRIRLAIAILLVVLVVFSAGGAWAAQKYKGTVPALSLTNTGGCGKVIDMGTAIFTALGDDCTMTVERVPVDSEDYAPAPEGMACLGDVFEVKIEPPTVPVKVCYAYPPALEEKNASISKLNEQAKPAVWAEIPGAQVEAGVVCVTSQAGYFTLIGNP